MSSGIRGDTLFVISVIIGIILAIVSVVMWRIDQTIAYALMVAAWGIPLVVYMRYKEEVDLDDFLPEVEEDEEEYVPEVKEAKVVLSELPIETIEGIGDKFGKLLRAEGIDSVQDLVNADAKRVAEITGVRSRQAERWIAMARFAELEVISEEDAEAIVVAVGIQDLKGLAKADANKLLVQIQKAVAQEKVRIPAGYEFTLEKVKSWIAAAKKAL